MKDQVGDVYSSQRFFKFILVLAFVFSSIYLVNWRMEINEDNRAVSSAKSLLIHKYGQDYFEEHFELFTVYRNNHERCVDREVIYQYLIEIGEYRIGEEVILEYDGHEISSGYGLPYNDNLLPFTITKEDAIRIATDTRTEPYESVSAYIRFKTGFSRDTMYGKHVWKVVFKGKVSTEYTSMGQTVFVDPKTGEILEKSS